MESFDIRKPFGSAFSRLKDVPGWYSIHEDGACVYVGQTIDFFGRLTFHASNRPDVEFFRIFPAYGLTEKLSAKDSRSWLDYREACLIQALDPVENVKRPNVWSLYKKLPFWMQQIIMDHLPSV